MRTNSYIEWYNENEGRAYPLAEAATQIDNSNQKLPPDIIVDAGILVPGSISYVYISSVRFTNETVSIGISSSTSGLLIGTYTRSELKPYAAYPLTSLVDNVAGWIAFGAHLTQASSGIELYRFNSYLQSGFETKVVKHIDPPYVTNVYKRYGQADQSASGIIKLDTGAGVEIVKDPNGDPHLVILRLNADMKYNIRRQCATPTTEEACGVPPLRALSGVTATTEGKITIRFE